MKIRPWEWKWMNVEETEIIHGWLDAYEEAQQKATEQLKKGR